MILTSHIPTGCALPLCRCRACRPVTSFHYTVARHPSIQGIPAHCFTLLELIVVVGVIGVMLAVGAPSLRNMLIGQTITQESARMLALTQYAVKEAVSNGTPLVLWYDTEENRYGLAYGDSDQEDLLAYNIAANIRLDIDETFCDSDGICTISVFPDGTISDIPEKQEICLLHTMTLETVAMTFDEYRKRFQLEEE